MKKRISDLLSILLALSLLFSGGMAQTFALGDSTSNNLAPQASDTVEEHTITFMSYNGQRVLGTRTGKSNFSTSGVGTSPKGYQLVGWKSTPTDVIDGDNENASGFVKFDSDKTVYARYRLKTYTLTISYNNGKPSTQKKFTIFSDPIVLPMDLTREHYTFQKWSGAGLAYDGTSYYLPKGSAGNQIANALWIPDSYPDSYYLHFDSQGGSSIPDQAYDYDSPLSKLPEPTREGYRFQGWYSAATGGEQLTSSTHMPAHDLTCYARWTPITYFIELHSKADEIIDGVKHSYIWKQIPYTIESETFVLPEASDKEYFFDGWVGEGIEEPQKTVTIPKGSSGHRDYYAVRRVNPCAYQHDYADVLTPATTESEGEIASTCKNCGAVQKTMSIPKVETIRLLSTSYLYDGTAKKPKVEVVLENGMHLSAGTDYIVSYTNNINVGTGTATITLKGNYSGTIHKTFVIQPKGTTIRSLYPESKKITAKWNAQAIQTTGYQLEYSTQSAAAKVITVPGNKTTAYVLSNLTNHRTYAVRIRTYTKVDDKTYYSAWSSPKKVFIDTIQLSPKSDSLYQGQRKQFTLKYIPSGAKVTWKSSNTKVATVSSSGKVTAKKLGKTTITAQYQGKTYKAAVKVTYLKPDMAALLYDYNTRSNYFVLIVKNHSPKPLTILKGKTKVLDCQYKNLDRTVSLSKSVTLKPGQCKKIKFKVVGRVTWFDYNDFTLYYNFKLDGKTYRAKSDSLTISKYKSGSSWVNTYREKEWFVDWVFDVIE